MKKIIIASDSFKGSVDSIEVAVACEQGIRRVYPDCEVVKLPVADGGEGLTKTLVTATQGRYVRCRVYDPLLRSIEATYGILPNGTAVIEMAAASGLPLVEPELRNPLLTTTYGTGQLIRDALLRGCRKLIVGIGGSATNDAGVGMLQALGMCFATAEGNTRLQGGQALEQIVSIDRSGLMPELAAARFTVACDVDAPFCGPNGAAYVFAPQKGATPEMVQRLDKGMQHFARIVQQTTGWKIETKPGAGAAGGLGGAFQAFLPAKLQRGIDTVLRVLQFEEHLQGADLVFTGEGRLDAQTLMGKAPWGVLQAARQKGVPVIALAGQVADRALLVQAGFREVCSIHRRELPLEQAMEHTYTLQQITATTEYLLRTTLLF